MKNLTLFTYITISFLLTSCSNDDNAEMLATPTLDWNATSIINDDILEISITINSEDQLPEGKLEFQIDDVSLNTYSPNKGTNTYTTNYSFQGFTEHKATIVYTFNDGRNPISKSKNIKKSMLEAIENSTKNDWQDLN
ncbi:hypothetical protein U6A24_21370 [Aquimarina gracilis]|uniref:Uncharacterized protein n=1 Tax=Aquimarina gracilis TaxID=874422 RepID=A0ABU6A1K3_9FLAO|nr:hypothetical protein [Aquimarina gracilis]MEB3348040.1 hypothetical protein [Aquimarina gracilis]